MLFLYCWAPASMLIVRAVQSPYSRQPPTDKQAGAIVVLAGAVRDPFLPLPLPLLGNSTYERCRYAAWLYHEWHSLPLVLSGGSLHSDQLWSYADVMRDFLLRYGVPESQLIIENRSRSTDENAWYTVEILRHQVERRRSSRRCGPLLVLAARTNLNLRQGEFIEVCGRVDAQELDAHQSLSQSLVSYHCLEQLFARKKTAYPQTWETRLRVASVSRSRWVPLRRGSHTIATTHVEWTP